jgi:magnesium chelatase subunit I
MLTAGSSVDGVTDQTQPTTPTSGQRPAPTTLGQLRASGHEQKHLRQEIRDNLLSRLREGVDPWPGLHGFSDTVIPQVERALLAGHDVVLLGERGQGKTRLLRALVGLLDEWTPVVEDSSRSPPPRSVARPRRATTCGWPGGTATSGTPRSSRRRTPASPTSSATSTR